MGLRGLYAAALLALGGCGDNLHLGDGTLVVTPLIDLQTSEGGATAQVSVALASEPGGDVTVALASTNAEEGTVAPATLRFTPESYDRPQVAIITGVDDDRADGDQPYVVRISGTNLDEVEVDVENQDDDEPAIEVSPLVGLVTSEAGATAQFAVRLGSQPFADVTVPLATSDATEGAPDRTSLTFTGANWSVPQSVTVAGVGDAVVDGTVAYAIAVGAATSSDTAYDGLDADDVALQNTDDDTGGIAVTGPAMLATSEAGAQASFAVVLQTQPAADVTIAVSSSDVGEATASKAQLVFTPATWNVAQSVAVTGANDFLDDGAQPFTIVLGAAVSTDAMYAGVDPGDIPGSNSDDDTAGVLVTPLTGLTTSEAGGGGTFTVVLTSQPLANVVIDVASSDLGEGLVAPATLTFTPGDWNQPKPVQVTGVDDAISDGIQAYAIVLAPAASGDSGYSGIDPSDVAAANLDNDTTGVTVDPINGLVVSELADATTFTIVLDTAPTAAVTISLASSDPSEGTVSPSSVTFTPASWAVPQTVTVTGVNDALVDGNVNFNIVTGAAVSGDPAYNGLAVPNVAATTTDDETAQVYVRASRRLTVSENGQSATFQVRLMVAPTASVSCPLVSTDLTEGVVSPQTLVFGPSQFGFQTVTVAGVDDALKDGDVPFTIRLDACSSTDARYGGFNPRDVAALNRDND